MTEQNTKERMSAHINSTSELILEVLEAQNVPYEIAVVAMWQSILDLTMKNEKIKNLADFIDVMRFTIDQCDAAVPNYMIGKLAEAYKAVGTQRERVAQAIIWLSQGPQSIRVKDGKVIR